MEHEGMLLPKGSTAVLHFYTMFHSHIRFVFLHMCLLPHTLSSLVPILCSLLSNFLSLNAPGWCTIPPCFTHTSVNPTSSYPTVGTKLTPSTPSWRASSCPSVWANAIVLEWIWHYWRWGDITSHRNPMMWHDDTSLLCDTSSDTLSTYPSSFAPSFSPQDCVVLHMSILYIFITKPRQFRRFRPFLNHESHWCESEYY